LDILLFVITEIYISIIDISKLDISIFIISQIIIWSEIMTQNDRPILGDSNKNENEQNDKTDCNSDLSKYLKEYDIILLKSMKGFGKTMILWLISKHRSHGYELMSKINEISPSADETVRGPSKIYPVLHDLEEEGLIEGSWEMHGKRKVKYYEITDEGIQTLVRIRKVFRCHRTPILEEFWKDMFSKNEE
jgi:PadR family transcriptional regulator PadR